MARTDEAGGAEHAWSRVVIGTRIDALESALNAFETRSVESLIPLRRRIARIEVAARNAGQAAIAAWAESARHADAAEVHQRTTNLLALLRQAAHEAKAPVARELVVDPATGLSVCSCLCRRLDQALQAAVIPQGMLALGIDPIERIRSQRGDAAVLLAVGHVGAILRKTLREHDCIARLGEDQWVAFLRGEDLDGIRVAIERMKAAVARKPIRWEDGTKEALGLRLLDLGPAPSREETRSAQKAVAPRRIGILTESETTGKMFRILFERAGYEVALCGRPDAAALKALGPLRVRLAVVDADAGRLTDVLDGIAASHADRRLPAILVIGQEADRDAALEHGALDFLAKPVQPDSLSRAAERLLSRGRRGKPDRSAAQPCVLLASEDLIQLIAMGSALQRQAGLLVRLCLGGADAVAQVRRHRPVDAVIDLRLDHPKMAELLSVLKEQAHATDIILVCEEREKRRAETISKPAIAKIIVKPVSLLGLAATVTATTGMVALPDKAEAAETLRLEILRVMALSHATAK